MNQNLSRILIKKCRSCFSKNLVDILSLGEQYLSDFTLESRKPPMYPLDLVLCPHCYLVQLKHTIPQSVLYTERYGYKSGINQTMRNELREVVEKAQKKANISSKDFTVVDIGANDGTLLSNYKKEIFRVGVEPIKKFTKECKRHSNVVINDFFSYKIYFRALKRKKADIITAVSCFYDIDKPNEFLSGIKKILHRKGILVIQQNYLAGMLKYNAFDNIVHEHLEYYSLLSLENLLKRHNLEVFDVELSKINGGSFRTYISLKNSRVIKKSVVRLRNYEKKLNLDKKEAYVNFANRSKKNRDKLFDFIAKLKKENNKIYIYGASTRGNTLLQFCNLDSKTIKAAVERNPYKWGKKISSVGIPIISEEQARKDKPDYMLVLPWFFKEEFLKREKDYLNSGGHFIFPLPRLHIV